MIRRLLAVLTIITAAIALAGAAEAHAPRSVPSCPQGWLCTSVLPHHGYCRYAKLWFPYVGRNGRIRRLEGDVVACLRVPLTIAQPDRLGAGGRVFYERLRFSWRGRESDGLVAVCPSQRVVKVWEPRGVGAEETATKAY